MADAPFDREKSEFVQPALLPMDTAQRGRGPFVWRFNRTHRIFHALVILTFYTLVLTGVPLRYSCAPFSEVLMTLWGGVERAGLIHRIAAGVMVAYTLVFVAWLGVRFARAEDKLRLLWGSDSMVPHPRDGRDFLSMWRWFFTGRGRPRFGRYGYLEKLDFFGEVWGFAIIGGSGILLWFPEFWGQWLPGWWFNVATVFHGYEAMIAAGFIFVVHFFNVHLRPDKFPLDAVMFHGRATLDYMVEEHPLMVDDLEQLRNAEISHEPILDRRAPPPPAWTSLVSALFGFVALAIGILCIGMILWAVAFC
jgi:cytochrome b subunit of formate dehydrogenase